MAQILDQVLANDRLEKRGQYIEKYQRAADMRFFEEGTFYPACHVGMFFFTGGFQMNFLRILSHFAAERGKYCQGF